MMNNVLKIIQVNIGDFALINRSDQLNEILTTQKPHIMIVNELNVELNDNISKNCFGKYKLETDKLQIVDKLSRTGVLIHPE